MKFTLSNVTAPPAGTSTPAFGASCTLGPRVRVAIPSCTVPMFSNSDVICHMIQCDMPLMRSAMAVIAATAPVPT
ncbi:hypothetical protein D3C81_1557570 [compost metagenome]